LESQCIVSNPIFIKYSPLLDPYRYMTGKYHKNTGLNVLPNPYLTYSETDIEKIRDPNNVSYVDNFFSYLAGKLMHQHNIVHCLDYYGSFLGIQKVFKVNVSDDLEFLQSSDYFLKNVNKTFMMNLNSNEYTNMSSRSNKLKLKISETDYDVSVIAITLDAEDLGTGCQVVEDDCVVIDEKQTVYEKEINSAK